MLTNFQDLMNLVPSMTEFMDSKPDPLKGILDQVGGLTDQLPTIFQNMNAFWDDSNMDRATLALKSYASKISDISSLISQFSDHVRNLSGTDAHILHGVVKSVDQLTPMNFSGVWNKFFFVAGFKYIGPGSFGFSVESVDKAMIANASSDPAAYGKAFPTSYGAVPGAGTTIEYEGQTYDWPGVSVANPVYYDGTGDVSCNGLFDAWVFMLASGVLRPYPVKLLVESSAVTDRPRGLLAAGFDWTNNRWAIWNNSVNGPTTRISGGGATFNAGSHSALGSGSTAILICIAMLELLNEVQPDTFSSVISKAETLIGPVKSFLEGM